MKRSCAVAPSTPDSLAKASLSIKDWASSLRSIPAALAIASCWITFIFAKLAEVPTCFAISSAAFAVSPFNANPLARSKFKSLPVNSSALNSLSMEDSNCNKLWDIFSACSKFKPNCLALTAASATASALPPKVNFKEADALDTSRSTCFSFITSLFREAYAWAPPNISFVFCSNDLPFNKDICWIPYNSSLVYPACSLSLVNVLRSASFSLAFDPNCAPTNVKVSWRFLVFKAASIDVAAMLPSSRLTFRASE